MAVRYLLDVNVLVALTWPNHVHHSAARDWFAVEAGDGWATTPMTEAGFVRVSSNGRVIPLAVSPSAAIGVLSSLCQLEGHEFWADDVRLLNAPLDLSRLAAYRQVSDAHLVLVAHRHGGRLATFDRGVVELLEPKRRDLVTTVT